MGSKAVSQDERVDIGRRVQVETLAFLSVLLLVVTGASMVMESGRLASPAARSAANAAAHTDQAERMDTRRVSVEEADWAPGVCTSCDEAPHQNRVVPERSSQAPRRTMIEARVAPAATREELRQRRDGSTLPPSHAGAAAAGPYVNGDIERRSGPARHPLQTRGAPATGPPERVCRPAATLASALAF